MATKRASKKQKAPQTNGAIVLARPAAPAPMVLRQSDALAAPGAPAKPRRMPPRRRAVEVVSVEVEEFKRSEESIGDALSMADYRGHRATADGWTLVCKRCKAQGTISETGYEGALFEGACER